MVACLMVTSFCSCQNEFSSFHLRYGDSFLRFFSPARTSPSSLTFTLVRACDASLSGNTNGNVVFTYGSTLESGSPRFSIPGDFFTYVLFVGVVILVSDGITYPQSLQSESYKSSLMASVVKRCLFLYFPSHLAYLPAQHYLAEAVPGSEEDQPYTSYRSLSAVNPLDCMRCRMVGSPLR